MLRLWNTLIRKKQEFIPITKGKVHMYTCGPTVYDFAHIGNFRAYICADLLRRYLEFSGVEVKHVMNLTDVDDKTIRDSQEEGISLKDFTDRYIKSFFEDIEALNIEKAGVYPRATETIKEMVDIVLKLKEKGLAYKGDDGSWYYKIEGFEEYGKLSKIQKDDLKAGARVKQDEYEKDSVSDFALWKAWDKNDGNVFWETELGKGRPGWHIECSAMSMKYLGNHFDIHTGGIDLVFPHHENEIAQSEGCCTSKFVNYWVHNEWLLVDGKKMSKSLGNFYTLRDLLKKGYSAKAIRYALLSTHYKVQLNFTFDLIKAAQASIDRLQELVRKLSEVKGEGSKGEGFNISLSDCKERFVSAMDDDLNIANALAALFDFVKDANKALDKMSKKEADEVLAWLKEVNKVLGVMDFSEDTIPDDIKALAESRIKARKDKDWATADKIRDELKEKGYRIDDSADGQKVILMSKSK